MRIFRLAAVAAAVFAASLAGPAFAAGPPIDLNHPLGHELADVGGTPALIIDYKPTLTDAAGKVVANPWPITALVQHDQSPTKEVLPSVLTFAADGRNRDARYPSLRAAQERDVRYFTFDGRKNIVFERGDFYDGLSRGRGYYDPGAAVKSGHTGSVIEVTFVGGAITQVRALPRGIADLR